MAEETIDNTPAGAEGKQESAPIEKTIETKSNPSIVEQMFGDKANSEDEPKAVPPKPETPNEPDNPPDNPGPFTKKSAKDAVQRYAREKNEWKAKAEANAAEIDRLAAELSKYKSMKPEEMTPRDQYKEVYAEERMRDIQSQIHQELNEYAASHEDPAMFQTNYEYYMPILNANDQWTVNQLHRYPEKLKMYDLLFQAMTAGVFSMQEWIAAPQPLKMQKLKDIQKLANGDIDAQGNVTAPAKGIAVDSVVPDLKKGGATGESLEESQEAIFKKAMERGQFRI